MASSICQTQVQAATPLALTLAATDSEHRGAADGDASVWHLFSKVLALVADVPTIRRRIDARPNQFGKAPEELAAVLGRQASYEADYRRYGAIITDATRPLGEVVDEILAVSANDLP
jgi:hypothetical protein